MYLQLARFLLKVHTWATKSPGRIPYHFAFMKDLKANVADIVTATTEEELLTS
jgi:hypothetical protein